MRDDLLGKYGKPEISVKANKAFKAQKEREARLREVMLNVQNRIKTLEYKYGMEPNLSHTVMCTSMKPTLLANMWDQAVQKWEFKKIHDELQKFSNEITTKNKRGYEKALSFYRGTAMAEAVDVAYRGGGISKDGRYDFTSLTTDLGVAINFGCQRNGAILEYDGVSIRKTGKAIPVQYSHRHTRYSESIIRGLPLMASFEYETRIPDATEGPVLKRVMLNIDNTFTERLQPDIRTLEDAGIKVSAFSLRFGAMR